MEVFGEQLSSAAGCGRDTPPVPGQERPRAPDKCRRPRAGDDRAADEFPH